MRKYVFLDRGVVKFPILNRNGFLCGWMTLSGLVIRQQIRDRERLTITGGANVVSLEKKLNIT